MKKIVTPFSLLWLALSLGLLFSSKAEAQKLNEWVTISGYDFHVIQMAMPAFTQQGLDVSQYLINIYKTKSSFVVHFYPPDFQADKDIKIYPFEVELSRDDFRLIRSNFVR